jgi:3-oxoacyl-[acyl-carrier protein] reductase
VNVLGIQADVGSEADIRKIVDTTMDQFGRIDIVVNNAGVELYGDIGDVSAEQLSDLLRMKVLAPWEMARAVAPHMRKQGRGRIITVISDAGKIPGRSAVGGAAQLAFVKSLADELGPSNVLATGVSVGHIKESDGPEPPVRRNPFVSRSLEQHESNWAMDVPLGRWGTPSDVANAVAFLSSESASFICGSNLDVDGGDQRSIF